MPQAAPNNSLFKPFNALDQYARLNPHTRMMEPILWRGEILPFSLGPDSLFSSDGTMVVNASGSVTAPFQFKLKHSSISLDDGLGNPLLINRLTYADTAGVANSAFTIQMKDMGDETQFMNQPIHIRTFAGTSQLPAVIGIDGSEWLFLPSLHTLLVTYNKITGGSTTVRMPLWGKMFYTWSPDLSEKPDQRAIMVALINKLLQRRKFIFPFWLTTEQTVTLAANQAAEFDALVGDDGHFEATHLMAVSTGAFQAKIFNPETKQTLSNGTIANGASMGDARNPMLLPIPWLVPKGQRIRIQFTDLSGSSNSIFFTMRGRKIRAPLKNLSEVKNDLALPADMMKVIND